MSDHANVRSTDAIESVRTALTKFLHQSEEGLVELDAEMRRVLDYLEHDRPAFWKAQTRLAEDGVHTAKMELQRALMFPVGVNERPAATEQRAALAKAEARLAYCREKMERLRHWVRQIRTELPDYQGRMTQFRSILDSDGPAAVAVLERLLRAVEKYTQASTTLLPEGRISPPADEQQPQPPSDAGDP